VVKVVVTFAQSHESRDEMVLWSPFIVKRVITKKVSHAINAECRVMNHHQSQQSCVVKATLRPKN